MLLLEESSIQSLQDYPTLKGDSRLQAKRLVIQASFLGNVVFLSFYLPFLSARLKCIIRTSPYVRSPHPSLPRDGKMLWTPALEQMYKLLSLWPSKECCYQPLGQMIENLLEPMYCSQFLDCKIMTYNVHDELQELKIIDSSPHIQCCGGKTQSSSDLLLSLIYSQTLTAVN